MTERPTIDGDLDRLYAEFREFRDHAMRRINQQEHRLASLAVDAHQKAMVTDKRLGELERVGDAHIDEANRNIDRANDQIGWVKNIISNLYDDPIPSPKIDWQWDEYVYVPLYGITFRPTEAEWDEAHRENVFREWHAILAALVDPVVMTPDATDTFMGIFGFRRECPCCGEGE